MNLINEDLLKKTNVVVNAYSNKHNKYIPILFTYYGIHLIPDNIDPDEKINCSTAFIKTKFS